MVRLGGGVPPPEENTDLPGFTPERAHLLLQGVYGDYLHHFSFRSVNKTYTYKPTYIRKNVPESKKKKTTSHQMANRLVD